jgi:hypothetical protein
MKSVGVRFYIQGIYKPYSFIEPAGTQIRLSDSKRLHLVSVASVQSLDRLSEIKEHPFKADAPHERYLFF